VIDLGISKMALIGAVALIVIGPEKLPRVARTVGTLLGKAQRYVNDVKAEVNRSMELDELRKMKDSVVDAARDVENSVRTGAADFEKTWSDAVKLDTPAASEALPEPPPAYPEYKHPKKKWRIKQGATPQWYKARNGIRTRALSGAARVARYRPKKFN
jgi:sec-independent protein translocase protein TatB